MDFPEPVAPRQGGAAFCRCSQRLVRPKRRGRGRNRAGRFLEFGIIHQTAEAYDRGGFVRHLNAHERFSGDRRFDADRLGGERKREIGIQRRDARELDAFSRFQCVARNGGTDVDLSIKAGMPKLSSVRFMIFAFARRLPVVGFVLSALRSETGGGT